MRRPCRFGPRAPVTLLGLSVLAASAPGCSETPRLSFSLQPGKGASTALAPAVSSPSVAIQAPAAGALIPRDRFDGMTGSVSGLPPGQHLFTFARDPFRNFFL